VTCPVLIRTEKPEDVATISALISVAFRKSPHGDGGEAAIVEQLRDSGDLALSLVAVAELKGIVGQVAFSPVKIESRLQKWFGLGPVSVAPEHRRRGIAAALIRRGLEMLETQSARGCVVLGNPAYYRRFGFEADEGMRYPGPPPAYFQRLVLAGDVPTGIVSYAPAFG